MNIKIFLLVSFIFLLSINARTLAQDEENVSGTEDSSAGEQAEITFEDSEDSSLFVEYYRLNAGDTIYVQIVTDIILSYTPMLDEEGYIVLPVIGRIKVSDLTVGEARELLQQNVDMYYQRAWVSVRIYRLSRVKFYVYGDIYQPGFYTANGATTFFDFLQSFGLTNTSNHRRIVHVRGDYGLALPESTPDDPGKITVSELIEQSLALADSTDTADIELDPRVSILDPLIFTVEGKIEEENFYLENGDVIYIPEPVVAVNVNGFRRSGVIEVLEGETWADIIEIAGSPGMNMNLAQMMIERRDEDGKLTEILYNLNQLDEEQLASIPLCNRDRLRLLDNIAQVFVLGEVNLPGVQVYAPNSTILDYLALAGGATQDAHLDFATIIRPPRDPRLPIEDGEMIQVNLVDLLLTGDMPIDVRIQPGDIIFIPDQGERMNFSTIMQSLSVLINALRLFNI